MQRDSGSNFTGKQIYQWKIDDDNRIESTIN